MKLKKNQEYFFLCSYFDPWCHYEGMQLQFIVQYVLSLVEITIHSSTVARFAWLIQLNDQAKQAQKVNPIQSNYQNLIIFLSQILYTTYSWMLQSPLNFPHCVVSQSGTEKNFSQRSNQESKHDATINMLHWRDGVSGWWVMLRFWQK